MTFAFLPDSIVAAWPSLSPVAAKVAGALAARMNAEGTCWPSWETLMGDSGIRNRNKLSRALRELQGAGLRS